MEKIKNYQKPSMRVVKLKHQSHLLQGTTDPEHGGGGSRELRRAWKDED